MGCRRVVTLDNKSYVQELTALDDEQHLQCVPAEHGVCARARVCMSACPWVWSCTCMQMRVDASAFC